ncbi:hypothetical protein RBG61_01615 [Paludicola sp. MB14-C6]|nr:hypothetical protein [Paludicola sp. MB14-C6]WMJ23388.1 hypothetical protein RBG61_01615 [Paludicola sp. MB14-C6]
MNTIAGNLKSKEDAEDFVEEYFGIKDTTISPAIIVEDQEQYITII